MPSSAFACFHLLRAVFPKRHVTQLMRISGQRRKEQNRKAQRNHRLRSEAKLEQLRAKVKTQADEIVMLRDFNQSLMKHIETFEFKGKDEGKRDAGEQSPEGDVAQEDTSESP